LKENQREKRKKRHLIDIENEEEENKDFGGSMLELKRGDFTTPRSIPNTNKRLRSTTLQSKKSKKSISKLKKEERKKLHQQQIGIENNIENNKNSTIEGVRQRITELQEELKEIKKRTK